MPPTVKKDDGVVKPASLAVSMRKEEEVKLPGPTKEQIQVSLLQRSTTVSLQQKHSYLMNSSVPQFELCFKRFYFYMKVN